jgi:hypothetical protein
MAFTPLTKTNSCPRIREARSHRRFRGLNGGPLRWTPPPVLPCYCMSMNLETAGWPPWECCMLQHFNLMRKHFSPAVVVSRWEACYSSLTIEFLPGDGVRRSGTVAQTAHADDS